MITLRDATPDDLPAVTALFLRCWRESYAEVLPTRVIEAFDETSATELWRRALETPRPGTHGLVAVEGEPGAGEQDADQQGADERADRERVVGIVRMGRDPDEPAVGHVFSLYVDPATQGGGVGRGLLTGATSWLHDGGCAEATLWVFEANRRARAFYALNGWQPDGGTRVEPEFGEPEVRLRRAF